MGIKFLCPNGHKLNVKSFLSGKKAICPKCGARVLVPAESTIENDQAAGESLTLPTVPMATATADEVISQASAAAASSITAVAPAQPAADPLAEAPAAVWYVRPASGGQFGPAPSEIMRNWLDQGRVGASSLVWREGWSEWRSAAAVFPQLAALLASPAVATTTTVALPVGVPVGGVDYGTPPAMPAGISQEQIVQPGSAASVGAPAAERPNMPLVIPDDMLAGPVRRRPRRNDKSILASAVLAIVIVILLVVLFVIARRGATTEESTSSSATHHRQQLRGTS